MEQHATAGTESSQGVDTAPPRLLVVDDERSMRELLSIVLRREGYDVTLAENGRAAIDRLERARFDLLISDIKMPDMSGVDVLRAAKRIDQDILCVMITAFASADTAIEAMRLGAHDYLSKPFDVDELKIKVRNALEQRQLRQENVLLKRALGTTHQFGNIVGRSEKMLSVFKLIEQIARTDSTVLVTGESGTGKEWVARAIHFYSLRRDRPFVALNCGALPETLLESELFGHMKGAFTGASVNKKGLIEAAEKGTLFLDEIGEMTPMMQVKLLRVLQERKFRRLGGVEELETAMRVIAATNQDLTRLIADGKFREDLFYRINVIPIQLPPLRERGEDIPLLAQHFLAKYGDQMGKHISGLSQDAMGLLGAYEWPGNIRELENVIERAVALEKSAAILPESLPEHIVRRVLKGPAAAGSLPESGFDLEEHVKGLEREYIAQALHRAGGVQMKAAELLGMSFRSFRYYAKKYNLT
ncbi:MAG: sigma-54 dependent transcriptional regulator [Vicinamibacterales bacterium]|nr:sigma-54 dependent transcriptional regulator [Vicinamibacterales bacterium]